MRHETNQEKTLLMTCFHVIIQDAIFICHFEGIIRSLCLSIRGRTSARVRSSTSVLACVVEEDRWLLFFAASTENQTENETVNLTVN